MDALVEVREESRGTFPILGWFVAKNTAVVGTPAHNISFSYRVTHKIVNTLGVSTFPLDFSGC